MPGWHIPLQLFSTQLKVTNPVMILRISPIWWVSWFWSHPNPTQKSNRVSNRIKIVFKVSKYTNIFGMVQMLEAFCLAPFVGAVIDFSGPVLSVYRRTIPWRIVPFNVPEHFYKIEKFRNFRKIFWKILKMIHLMKNACFTS